MSSFSPELMKLMGAMLTTAPDADKHPIPGQAPAAPAEQSQGQTQSGVPQGSQQAAMDTIEGGQKTSSDLAENALQGQEVATKAGMQAVDAQKKASIDEARAKQPTLDALKSQIDAFDTTFTSAMGKVEARTEQAFNNYLAAVNDYKDTHVYSWWHDASTGAAVLGMISQVLAGGLQGLTGNIGAATPLDKIIDRDWDTKQAALQQKGNIAGQAKGLYSDLQAQLKDEVAVQGAVRDIAYQSTIKRLEIIANTTTDQKEKANALAMKAKLLQDHAAHRSQVLENLGSQLHAGSLAEADLMKSYESLWSSSKAGMPKEALAGVTNSEYLEKETRSELGKKLGNYGIMLDTAKKLSAELATPLKNYEGKDMDLGERRGALRQYVEDIKMSAHVAFGTRGDEATMKHIDDLLGTTQTLAEQWDPRSQKSTTAIEQRLDRFKALIKAHRHQLVKTQAVIDPATGQQVPLDLQEEE